MGCILTSVIWRVIIEFTGVGQQQIEKMMLVGLHGRCRWQLEAPKFLKVDYAITIGTCTLEYEWAKFTECYTNVIKFCRNAPL